MRTNRRTFPAAEIARAGYLAPLDLAAAFGRTAALEVDLGCGDGNLLVSLAREHAERNYLGVERLIGRVRNTSRKIGDGGLTNARILREDILHTVQHLLPPESVDVFYLMFPDPWPKRRHEIRRTFSVSFLRAIARALKPRGVLLVATDDADYFEAMQRVMRDMPGIPLRLDAEWAELPASTFEAKFRQSGAAVHRFALRKL